MKMLGIFRDLWHLWNKLPRRRWSVQQIPTTSEVKLQRALGEGWEPFAVALGKFCHIVFLKKRVWK